MVLLLVLLKVDYLAVEVPNPSGYRVESNTYCQKRSLQFVVRIVVHETEITVTLWLAFQKSDSGFFSELITFLQIYLSFYSIPYIFFYSFVLCEKNLFLFLVVIFSYSRWIPVHSSYLVAVTFDASSPYPISFQTCRVIKCVRQSNIRLCSMRELLFSLDCTLKVKSHAVKLTKLNY